MQDNDGAGLSAVLYTGEIYAFTLLGLLWRPRPRNGAEVAGWAGEGRGKRGKCLPIRLRPTLAVMPPRLITPRLIPPRLLPLSEAGVFVLALAGHIIRRH